MDFSKSLKEPVPIMTWDRRMLVWMSSKQLNEMFLETCLIGPLAAMFGREFQQFLLTHKKADKIPCSEMEYSVNSGRTSLSDEKIGMVKHCKIDKDYGNESFAQSERTRSPRRRPPYAEPWKQSPANRYDFDIRDAQRSVRDVRDLEHVQEGLRGTRPTYLRDCDDYSSRDRLIDYYMSREARGSTDTPPRELPREPRPYTKRPRSSEREDRERQRRYD